MPSNQHTLYEFHNMHQLSADLVNTHIAKYTKNKQNGSILAKGHT